jgi:hypothetical protein
LRISGIAISPSIVNQSDTAANQLNLMSRGLFGVRYQFIVMNPEEMHV